MANIDVCHHIAFTSADWQKYGDSKIIPDKELAFEICTDNSVKAKFGNGINVFNDLPYVNQDLYRVVSDKIDKIKNAISKSGSTTNGTATLDSYVLDNSQIDISFISTNDITGMTITCTDGTHTSILTLPNLLQYDVFSYTNGIATINGKNVTVTGNLFAYKNSSISITVSTGTITDISYSYIQDLNEIINLNIVNNGETANRPTNPVQYQQFWDDTLNKLIVYKGSAWYDTSGNEV
jgi:hypothetical protein